MISIIIALTLSLSPLLSASVDQGTLTRLTGQVEILAQAQQDGATPVLYLDKTFYLRAAELGDSVNRGDVIRTGDRSIARIVFDNGDQFMMGPGSEYVLEMNQENGSSVINMMRGRVKATVSPEGPRNNLEVESRNVSMGVRGTEFYLDDSYLATEVSVIRGEVELVVTEDAPADAVEFSERPSPETVRQEQKDTQMQPPRRVVQRRQILSAGNTAQARIIEPDAGPTQEATAPTPRVDLLVAGTSQQRLAIIQENTTVSQQEVEPLIETISQERRKEIERLEQQARKSTLNDIRNYDIQLYETIIKSESESVDEINSKVLARAMESAPVEEKIPARDVLAPRRNPYQRYFTD